MSFLFLRVVCFGLAWIGSNPPSSVQSTFAECLWDYVTHMALELLCVLEFRLDASSTTCLSSVLLSQGNRSPNCRECPEDGGR